MNLLFLGGGLWIIPALLFGGAIVFTVQSLLASKSGATKFNKDAGKNVPFYKVPVFKYAAALWIVGIIVLIMMYSDR